MKRLAPQMQFVLKILDFVRINPYHQNVYTRIYQVFAFILCAYVVITHLLDITLNFNGIDTVGRTRFTPCILIKNYQFVFYAIANESIKRPLDCLKDFWPWDKFGTGIAKKMQATHDKSFFFIKFYFWLIWANVVIMVLEAYLSPAPDLVFNQYEVCDMANNAICYHIHYVISVVQLIFIYIPVVFAFDLYFLAFCGQLYIQFDLLKVALQDCKVGPDNPNAIKEIVDQHNIIISCVQSLDSWMSGLFLAKYMGFLIQMTSALYMLTYNGIPSLMEVKTYGLHFMTVALMTYMYCYGAALIYEQSLSVAEVAYTVNWAEKGQTKVRRDVAFIIMRSQRPSLFTAGYFNLNMEAFVSAMQNVFSIYGLLTTLAADEIMARQISKEMIRN